MKKLNTLKMATSELENRKAIPGGLVLSAEERVAAVEELEIKAIVKEEAKTKEHQPTEGDVAEEGHPLLPRV